MKIDEHRPKSLSEFIDCISKLRNKHQQLWFRGIRKATRDLSPSIFRRKDIRNREGYTHLERSILDRFKERSLPYLTQRFSENWDWLFFMQHYGIPTRLLDWTENPFVALFFSIIDAEKKKRGGGFKEDAVVWVLDPATWNNTVLSFQGYQEGVLSTNDGQLTPFAPAANYKNIPDYQLAINGAYNSPRIVAQRGAFVIFGAPGHPMNKYYEDKVTEKCLFKIIIEKHVIGDIQNGIIQSGFSESVIFPDLEGLSRELKREFGEQK